MDVRTKSARPTTFTLDDRSEYEIESSELAKFLRDEMRVPLGREMSYYLMGDEYVPARWRKTLERYYKAKFKDPAPTGPSANDLLKRWEALVESVKADAKKQADGDWIFSLMESMGVSPQQAREESYNYAQEWRRMVDRRTLDRFRKLIKLIDEAYELNPAAVDVLPFKIRSMRSILGNIFAEHYGEWSLKDYERNYSRAASVALRYAAQIKG